MTDCLLLNGDFRPINTMVHESLLPWKDAIKLQWLDKITIVETYKDWHVHSQKVVYEVPAVAVLREYCNWDKEVKFTRRNVFLRDMYTCQYCHDVFDTPDLTFDHVVPKKYGGHANGKNIVTCCKPCNLKKGHNAAIVPDRMPVAPTYWALQENYNYDGFNIRHDAWRDYIKQKKSA